MSDTNLIAKALKNITTRLSRGGADSPVYSVNGQAPDKTGNADIRYMARLDKLNNFAVTPTVNGSAVWTADSLMVGGRNLFVDSASMASWLVRGSKTFIDGSVPGVKATSKNTLWQSSYAQATLKLGETYTLSNYVYSTVDSDSAGMLMYARAGTNQNGTVTITHAVAHPGEIGTVVTRHVYTFVSPIEGPCLFGFELSNTTSGNISTERWQLEQGSIATAWSPAPEDIQSQIDVINAKLDALAKA